VRLIGREGKGRGGEVKINALTAAADLGAFIIRSRYGLSG
jgi:hypothetical protein